MGGKMDQCRHSRKFQTYLTDTFRFQSRRQRQTLGCTVLDMILREFKEVQIEGILGGKYPKPKRLKGWILRNTKVEDKEQS